MRNVQLTIEYDGSRFRGWQIQRKTDRTVQGEITRALRDLCHERITVYGSGRTDSGVHAFGQVAHFKTKTSLKPPEIQKALNALLPEDIVIRKVQEVPDHFHAQYSAKSKTYRYTIFNGKIRSALNRQFVHFVPYSIDVRRMRKAAKCLLGRNDFKAFQASDENRSTESTVRTITELEVKKRGDSVLVDITADGFLYKMVRNIVGTLLSVGTGKLSTNDLEQILKGRDRKKAGKTAPARGLCLLEVRYK